MKTICDAEGHLTFELFIAQQGFLDPVAIIIWNCNSLKQTHLQMDGTALLWDCSDTFINILRSMLAILYISFVTVDFFFCHPLNTVPGRVMSDRALFFSWMEENNWTDWTVVFLSFQSYNCYLSNNCKSLSFTSFLCVYCSTGLTCWGLSVVFLIRISEDFGQFLVRHVCQLSQVQQVKVDLQRRHTAQRFCGQQWRNQHALSQEEGLKIY